MDSYLLLGHQILKQGRQRGDRTGTGTKSIRSAKLVFDMQAGFPLMTTKKVNLESVFTELSWILQGRSDMQYLEERGCGFIWRNWSLSEPVMEEIRYTDWQRLDLLKKEYPALYEQFVAAGLDKRPTLEGHAFMTEHGVPTHYERVKIPAGETNAPYGPAWRKWKGRDGKEIDQIKYLLDTLRTNPFSRRILLSAWDPANLPDESISPQENIKNGKPCLTPCHWAIEMYTDEMTVDERINWLVARNPFAWDKWVDAGNLKKDEKLDQFLDERGVPKHFLDLKWHQRSCDWAIGIPYNIASYGMLLMMFATTLNMVPRELELDGTNVHLYSNHTERFIEQFSRSPRALPQLVVVNKRDKLEDYVWEDFVLAGYNPHPFIKYDVSI
jgi:thymidylate synthase